MNAGNDAPANEAGNEPGYLSPSSTGLATNGRVETNPWSSIWRWCWLPLLGLLVGALSGSLAVGERKPSFRVESTLVIGPAASLTTPREIADSLAALDRRSVVATLAALPSSHTVLQLAQRQLGLSEAQLAPYKVRTTVVPDSNILLVTVAGPDGTLATKLANALTLQTTSAARGFYGIYDVQILDPAQLPKGPEADVRRRAILAGALLGLLIGLCAAFLLNRLWQPAGRRRAADDPGF